MPAHAEPATRTSLRGGDRCIRKPLSSDTELQVTGHSGVSEKWSEKHGDLTDTPTAAGCQTGAPPGRGLHRAPSVDEAATCCPAPPPAAPEQRETRRRCASGQAREGGPKHTLMLVVTPPASWHLHPLRPASPCSRLTPGQPGPKACKGLSDSLHVQGHCPGTALRADKAHGPKQSVSPQGLPAHTQCCWTPPPRVCKGHRVPPLAGPGSPAWASAWTPHLSGGTALWDAPPTRETPSHATPRLPTCPPSCPCPHGSLMPMSCRTRKGAGGWGTHSMTSPPPPRCGVRPELPERPRLGGVLRALCCSRSLCPWLPAKHPNFNRAYVSGHR